MRSTSTTTPDAEPVIWDPHDVADLAGAAVPSAPIPADGAPVHVAVDGDDAGRGTASDPWRTIAHATAAAPDGATIVVHGGTYRESAGDLHRPLHLMAAPGEAVTLTGTELLAGWEAGGDGTFSAPFTSPFPRPEGPGYQILPEQISPDAPMAGHLEQLFIDGEPLDQVATTEEVVGRADAFHYDRDDHRITIGADPAGRLVEVTTRPAGLKLHPGAAGSTVSGFSFSGFSPYPDDGFATVVVDAEGTALTDVRVTASAATGMAVFKPGVTLTRVTSSQNGGRGAVANTADGLVVAYSRFDDNNRSRFDYRDCGGGTFCVLAGLKVTRTAGLVVHSSSFSRNASTGLWCDLGCVDATFVGNVVEANARHGLYYEVSLDAIVAGNVIAGHVVPGTAALKITGSDNVTASRNTFIDNTVDIEVSDDPRDPAGELADAGIDTDPTGIVLEGNAFVESPDLLELPNDRAILETGRPSALNPVPGRFDRIGDNLYLLATAVEPGPPFRFRWRSLDGAERYVATPDAFAELSGDAGSATVVLDGRTVLDGYQLVGDAPIVGVDLPTTMVELIGISSDAGPGVGAWFAD